MVEGNKMCWDQSAIRNLPIGNCTSPHSYWNRRW